MIALLRLVVVACFAWAVSAAAPCSAQEPAGGGEAAGEGDASGAATARVRANVLYREGNALVKEGVAQSTTGQRKCLDALARYREASELFPSYKIDLNIGTALRAVGREVEAAVYYERFLERARGKASEEILRRAAEKLGELRRSLASLRVDASVAGARVEVNGEDAGAAPMERARYLAPGTYVVTVSHPGHYPSTHRLVLPPGKHTRLDVTLVSRAGVQRARQAWEAQQRRRQLKTVLGYGAVGLGVALAAGAGVAYGVAQTSGSDAHDRYRTTSSRAELDAAEGDMDAARDLLVVGHVLAGAAALAVGGGVYALVTRPEEAPPPAGPETGGVRVSVSPGAGGGLVSLLGVF